MRYHEPYGASDPNAGYVNGNPATGQPGSIPPAQMMEFPQREIVNAITASGQTPSDADLFQLWKAMQKAGGTRYAQDIGVENAVVAQPVPALTAYSPGVPLIVRIASSNTGAATINVSGLGVKSIVRKGSIELTPNDLVADSLALVIYDGNSWQLMNHGTTVYIGDGGGGEEPGEPGITEVENVGAGEGRVFAGYGGDGQIWLRTIDGTGAVKVVTAGNEIDLSLEDMSAELAAIDLAAKKFIVSETNNLAGAEPIDLRIAFMQALLVMGFTDFIVDTSAPTDRSVLWWDSNDKTAKRYNPILGNWFVLTPAQFSLHLQQRAFLAATTSTTLAAGDLFLFWDSVAKETKSISRDSLISYFSSQMTDYEHSEMFFLGMM